MTAVTQLRDDCEEKYTFHKTKVTEAPRLDGSWDLHGPQSSYRAPLSFYSCSGGDKSAGIKCILPYRLLQINCATEIVSVILFAQLWRANSRSLYVKWECHSAQEFMCVFTLVQTGWTDVTELTNWTCSIKEMNFSRW